MLYVRYDLARNQRQTKYSAYISFQYNPYYVTKIKELSCRYWIPESKEWEIPSNMVYLLKEIDNNITELNTLPATEKTLDDFNFKTEPYSYQKEGVQFGINMNSWLLGDEQGLGKTKQLIDLAVWKKENEGLKHCLIICGINNLKYNWIKEIGIHSYEDACILGKRFVKPNQEPSMADRLEDLQSCPDEFFWITNIETLRCHKEGRFYKSEIADLLNKYIAEGNLSLIVIDEVHKAKNPNSAQGRGLLKLKGCPKIGLSGTLLVKNPLDLYVPLKLIEAININFYSYSNRYTVKDNWGNPIGWKNMAEIADLLKQYMLRRTKNILDLPPKIENPILLEMSKEETKLYNAIVEEVRGECDKIANPVQALSKITRLRQICCHTGLVSTKVLKSTKFDYLREILEEAKANNEKVLVFSMFRELIEMAVEEFKEYNPLHIWGQMKQIELEEQRDTFQNGEGFQVLFGVIQAAGTGITLNQASTVVFLDLPWDRATLEQAEDRAHRIGTRKTVMVHILLMKDSYDEYLYNIVLSKGAMGKILVDGESELKYKQLLRCIFKKKGEYDDE